MKCETPGIVCLDIEERRKRMPTINQLVRQGRTDKTTKSKSPALNRGYNSLAKKPTITNSQIGRASCRERV